MKKVKQRRRGYTRISAKNQATLPVDALAKAGLRAGDRVRVRAEGAGRLVLERDEDLVARHAGRLKGVYPEGYLDELRREWP